MTPHGDHKVQRPTNPGGSGAVIVIHEVDGRRLFRKTVLGQTEKLRLQYDWYKRHQGLPNIPVLVAAGGTRDSFYFDLEYAAGCRTLFDFVHSAEPQTSIDLLARIVEFVVTSLHCPTGNTRRHDLNYLGYLNEKLMPKIDECIDFIPGFDTFRNTEEISINGRHCRGLSHIQHTLYTNARVRDYIATYEECEVQGDLTFENILVDGETDFLITDPNVGNPVSSSFVDFAKLYQSLHSGYEFLRKLQNIHIGSHEIIFDPVISETYKLLFEGLQKILADYVPPEQRAALIFHEAMHFARLLPYRARQSPTVFYACYGTMISLFNQFLEEFENDSA